MKTAKEATDWLLKAIQPVDCYDPERTVSDLEDEIEHLKRELAAKEAALEVLIKDFAKVNNEIVELRGRNDKQSDTILHLKEQLVEAGK